MEYKVGDRVKIEGILVEQTGNTEYPLRFESDTMRLSFTKDGRYYTHRPPVLELVNRPKQKVKRYLVLLKSTYDIFSVSTSYYSSINEFYERNGRDRHTVIRIIQESEKEFDE